jgi:hypothetical protein
MQALCLEVGRAFVRKMKISIEVVAVNNLAYSRIGGKPFMGAQYVCVDGRDSPIWILAEKPPLVEAMFVDLTCTDRAFRDGDGLKSGESDLLRRGDNPFSCSGRTDLSPIPWC